MNGSKVVSVRLNNNLFHRVRKLSNQYNISNSAVIKDILTNTHDLPHLVTRLDAKHFSAKSNLIDTLNRNYESLISLLFKLRNFIRTVRTSNLHRTGDNNDSNSNVMQLNRLLIEAVQLVRKSIKEVE